MASPKDRNEIIDIPSLRHQASQSLSQALSLSFRLQKPDGHWAAPVSANPTVTAQYIFLKTHYPELNNNHSQIQDPERSFLLNFFLSTQSPTDGGWGIAPPSQISSDLSTTIEVYLALRILGLDPHKHPALISARKFILSQGGLSKSRFVTCFFLAAFGIIPWSSIPQIPPEIILFPNWFTFNIYIISSWARSTLVPLVIIRHHEPVYALPGQTKPEANNPYLDELWVDKANKSVSFNKALRQILFTSQPDFLETFFVLADQFLSFITPRIKKTRLRNFSIKKCMEWTLSHQESSGDWGGIFPPMQNGVWALFLQGYSTSDRRIKKGMEAINRFAVVDHDRKTKWFQSTVSPCWDTALMIKSICEAGYKSDERLNSAVEWLKSLQLRDVDHGDWKIYSNTTIGGGWSFQRYNTHYPDVDDTAVVLMALVFHNQGIVNDDSIKHGVEWILGMQNRDGGWGAFDIGNNAFWLHKIPFCDMDNLVDPSTADVTGRVVECFGVLMKNGLEGEVVLRVKKSVERALEFLRADQKQNGNWWGRWGVNYGYGTGIVLRGLYFFCERRKEVIDMASKGVQWFQENQNEDGGWGEGLETYEEGKEGIKGKSTAANTAWAVESLMRFRPGDCQAVLRGIKWLVENQSPEGEEEERQYASWPSEVYVGVGFPNKFYLGYPFYHHYFCISALGRYIDGAGEELNGERWVDLEVNGQSVLMVVVGDRDYVELFLGVARKLVKRGHRVRFATTLTYRKIVEGNGCEWEPVGRINYTNEIKKPDIIVSSFNCTPQTSETPVILISTDSKAQLFWKWFWNHLVTLFLFLLELFITQEFITSFRINRYSHSMIMTDQSGEDNFEQLNLIRRISRWEANVGDVVVDLVEQTGKL